MFLILSDKARAVRDSSKNLCVQCRFYHWRVDAQTEKELRICCVSNTNTLPLTGPVARCNDFRDANRPPLQAMEQIAWTLDTSKRSVGFLPPKGGAQE
jgi:hypothetical protein